MWWRVKPPIDSEFLVLIIGGRVAVATRSYGLFNIGDRWDEARRTLEKAQFTCVMAPP